MSSPHERILVIRLGALGDLIFCFQAFHEIRQAHPTAEIALLTRTPFVAFAQALPWFDHVFVETHPTLKTPGSWLELRKTIRDFGPNRVYDLQGKTRQTVLYALLGGPLGPEWSGAAPLCTFPRPWPPKPDMHFMDFISAQLRAANVPQQPPPDLSWFDAPVEKFGLLSRYVVLVPGCSPKALYKRWPTEKFAELVAAMKRRSLTTVMIGSSADEDVALSLKKKAPDVQNLCGKTSLFELAGILRRAEGAIGNDTGPLHMAAALRTPTVALLSGRTNPVWSKPPGPNVAWRQSERIEDLKTEDALAAYDSLAIGEGKGMKPPY